MVIACGAGFLGSWTLRILAQRMFSLHLNEKVLIIDDGRIEDRNLPTQFYYPGQIMNSKASSAASVFKQYGIAVEAIDARLDAVLVVSLMSEDISLVIDCFDNLQGRVLSKMLGIQSDCLHASISPSRFGMVEWSKQWHLDPTKNCTPEPEIEVEVPPCELAVYQQLGILIGARTAVEATQHLLGLQKQSWQVTEGSTNPL